MTMAIKHYGLAGKRVWVAGHLGLVGSGLVRRLAGIGCKILTVGRQDLDLRRQAETESWMAANRPDAIFIAAGTVGGIQANNARPGEFLYDNLLIAANVIDAAHRIGVERVMFLASNCMYPRDCPQPMCEDSLLTGPFEPTNEAYAIAKLAGVRLCQFYRRQYGRRYIAVVPASIYGPGDVLDSAESHVISAAIRKVHEAKSSDRPVEIWGTGVPRREYLYVDDAADAMVFLMECYDREAIINIGGDASVSIRELYEKIAQVAGYKGDFVFDPSKPDGMPLKELDDSRIRSLGWRPRTELNEGLARTYRWFLEQTEN